MMITSFLRLHHCSFFSSFLREREERSAKWRSRNESRFDVSRTIPSERQNNVAIE